MDRELLFKPRLPEQDVELPGVGTIRVRALTIEEVNSVRKATDEQGIDGPRANVLNRKILAKAIVDPRLSEDEVGRWQKAAPAGEVAAVVQVVQELSGMVEGAAKAAYKSVRDGTGAGVSVLPGGETGDDGGGPTGEDG